MFKMFKNGLIVFPLNHQKLLIYIPNTTMQHAYNIFLL